MNEKDVLDLILNSFIVRNTSNSYNHLCNFVNAMRCGQYYPISDEEIRNGVECEKTQAMSKAKVLFMAFPEEMKKMIEATIELKYNQCLQQFLNYKYSYENQNNHVI